MMIVIIIVTITLSTVATIGSSIVATLSSSIIATLSSSSLSLSYDKSIVSSTESFAQIAVQCLLFSFP